MFHSISDAKFILVMDKDCNYNIVQTYALCFQLVALFFGKNEQPFDHSTSLYKICSKYLSSFFKFRLILRTEYSFSLFFISEVIEFLLYVFPWIFSIVSMLFDLSSKWIIKIPLTKHSEYWHFVLNGRLIFFIRFAFSGQFIRRIKLIPRNASCSLDS